MDDLDLLLGLAPEPAPTPAAPTTSKSTPKKPAAEKSPKPEPEAEATPDPAVAQAQAEAQGREVKAAADAYMKLLPEIRAARPQAPTFESEPEILTGEDWVVSAWKTALFGGDAASFGLDSSYAVNIFTREDAVIVEVTVPEHLAGPGRAGVAAAMIAEASRRQNLGVYEAQPAADKRQFFLVRRGAIDTSSGWREQPKTFAFWRGGDYRHGIFDLAGLVRKVPTTGLLRYPQCEFRSGPRGGEAVLTLPPGMLPADVVRAQAALRQALAQPHLEVDPGDGLRPVICLNSKAIVRAFPKVNPLSADRMFLPRTEAERYACSNEVRLFLGVTEDGDVVAPRLKDRSHAAIFGMTNSGKSTTMVVVARALAAQGAEVWLCDAKGTPEFRGLYREQVPGITHLSVKTPALMHATIHKLRELYRFRAAVADELSDRGLKVDDIIWPRVVCIWDEMGEFLNGALSDGGDKVAKGQAEATANMLGEVGAKARAYGVHLIVAGQHVYAAALPNKLKEHLSIRVVLGKASDTHIQRLFDEHDRDSAKAAREGIVADQKGFGIVIMGKAAVQFMSFYNDSDAAAKFAKAAAGTPRLRRWAHKFPVGNSGPGAHGAWQEWGAWEGDKSYQPEGTVEDIGTVVLDPPSPETAVWDMTSRSYSPGSPPRSAAFTNVN